MKFILYILIILDESIYTPVYLQFQDETFNFRLANKQNENENALCDIDCIGQVEKYAVRTDCP